MANVILGLLLIAPQSLYDLIKSFEAGVALFYSASSGSIKRALDLLLKDGLIQIASIEPRGRRRKVYRVTTTGRARFHEWMTGDPTGPDFESAALPRLFFLGLLEPAEREDVLQRIRQRADDEVAALTRLDRELDAVDMPADLQDVMRYQRATLEYGLRSGRFAAAWFDELSARD